MLYGSANCAKEGTNYKFTDLVSVNLKEENNYSLIVSLGAKY